MERMEITHSGNTAAQTPPSGRKEGLMASISNSISTFEAEVREFAAEFNTPSVRQMVTLCEAGRITWAQAYEISRQALANGLAAVAA